MNNSKINPDDYEFAGFWIRVGAGILDLIFIKIAITMLITVILLPIVFLLKYFTLPEIIYNNVNPFIIIIGIIINLTGLFYFLTLPMTRWQETLGMRVFGIKIIDESGKKISFLRSLRRFLSLWIIPLGSIAFSFVYYFYSPFFDLLSIVILISMATILSFLIIASTIAFRKYKRGLHDSIAKTYVVYS